MAVACLTTSDDANVGKRWRSAARGPTVSCEQSGARSSATRHGEDERCGSRQLRDELASSLIIFFHVDHWLGDPASLNFVFVLRVDL
uniref:Uncharacterized protein n=1 Tax=Arundo donax TaxID=35708 RepID=A0A0A9TME6_ARUDO